MSLIQLQSTPNVEAASAFETWSTKAISLRAWRNEVLNGTAH